MSRSFPRTVISLLAVLMAYAAYEMVAVPLMEPQLRLPKDAVVASQNQPRLDQASSHLHEQRHLFPPESWELDEHKTKVLDTEYGKLLFWEFQPLSDGSVEVKPFSVILYSKSQDRPSNDTSPQGARRAFVMRAPQGAVLRFDRPLKFGQTDIGRLVGGRLRGEIRIQSPPSSTTANDELDLVTRNIQIDGQRVFTPHTVKFRFGRHWGSGRNLNIQLVSANTQDGGKSSNLGIERIKSLELVHVERFHLDTGGRRWIGAHVPGERSAATPMDVSNQPTSAMYDSSAPLEITCRGPFLFDFDQSVASFEDQVDVLRMRADGPIDQLNCQLLEIHFSNGGNDHRELAGQQPAKAASNAVLTGMDAQKIVAVGHPVTVRSTYEMEAQRLEYELAPQGRVGVFWAAGPGKIYQVDENGQQVFLSHWKKELYLRPDGQKHVLSLYEGAHLHHVDSGQFEANDIHLWLSEIPQRATKSRFVPDKMLAEGNVLINLPQLSGSTRRVEAWFESDPIDASDQQEPSHQAASRDGVQTATPRRVTHAAAATDSRQAADQRFDVRGEFVQLWLTQQGKQTKIREAAISRKVRVLQTTTETPHDLPLEITGNGIRLVMQPGDDSAVVAIVGQPAHVQARGMNMSADRINLDQASNQLWIDGPGRMTLPPQPGRHGQSASEASKTRITWQERMAFDGRVARFHREVNTKSTIRQEDGELFEIEVDSDQLDIVLSGQLDFRKDKQQPANKPELQSFIFDGGVRVDNHRRDIENSLVSIDRLQVGSLSLDKRTNWLTATGPGWATTVHQGNSVDLAAPRPGAGRQSQEPSKRGLNYCRIDFQRGISGDLAKHEIQFAGQVRAVYGPVLSWDDKLDAERPDGLGEKGIWLSCEKLIAAEMGSPPGQEGRALEMKAIGDAVLKGRDFRANAMRMSYDQSKDLYVLEGSAREDAELHRTKADGQIQKMVARKILFSRSQNHAKVEDARYFNF